MSVAPASADTVSDAESPQLSLIEGNLNRPCLAIPIKANIQQLIGLVNVISIQDIPILSAPQNQQCADNSTQAQGDEPLSHILDQIPVLSSNGVDNG
ncbi:rodlin [Streptomyces sirii]|uniref:rodlin n=1 Tax=Streptomyces sirii TaxID=3127701 RepID=UPI003D364B36